MKVVELIFTDEEFNALLRLSTQTVFDPAMYKAIARKIILEELILNSLLTQEAVMKGAFALHLTPEPFQEEIKKEIAPKLNRVAKNVVGGQLKVPAKVRNGKESQSYAVLKHLLNNMVDSGRFYQFTSGDVADGMGMDEKAAYSALNNLATATVPWLYRGKSDDSGRVSWSFTQKAKDWLAKNGNKLFEAGIWEGSESG
jgi:hypothetical protein